MAFTTQTKVTALLSLAGENYLLEDLSASEQTTFWTDLLNETDSLIYLYTNDLYDASDLSGNYFLGEAAKWIAGFLATSRKGNPSYFTGQYERVMGLLEQIKEGELKIPSNTGDPVAQSSANMPAIANMIVDDRHKSSPIRVDVWTSAGEQSSSNYNYYESWWSW